MAVLTVVVNGVTPFDANTITINFQWSSNNQGSPTAAIGDSGTINASVDDLAAVLNQSILSSAAAASIALGVDIGDLDRKVLLGGFI